MGFLAYRMKHTNSSIQLADCLSDKLDTFGQGGHHPEVNHLKS